MKISYHHKIMEKSNFPNGVIEILLNQFVQIRMQVMSMHYFWFICLSHLFHCAWSPYTLLVEKARIHGVPYIQYFADCRDCLIWHNPEWKETNKLNSHIPASTPSCDVRQDSFAIVFLSPDNDSLPLKLSLHGYVFLTA